MRKIKRGNRGKTKQNEVIEAKRNKTGRWRTILRQSVYMFIKHGKFLIYKETLDTYVASGSTLHVRGTDHVYFIPIYSVVSELLAP